MHSGGSSSVDEEEVVELSSEEEDSEYGSEGVEAGRPSSRRRTAAAAAAEGGLDSDSDWDAGAAGADSDSDYEPDDAELLPEERQEQRWMEQQRRERSLVFTLAGGVGRGGSRTATGSRGGRRSSMPSVHVKMKAEPVTGGKPPRQAAQRQQQGGGGGGAEVISLLSSETEDAGPAAQRGGPDGGPGGPRTAASHPPSTLRLSFRAAAGTARQRLAVMRARTCTPLQRVLEALAVRCLEGGCAADVAALALSLGTARLDPEHTVRQAGLQDGDLIEVTLVQ